MLENMEKIIKTKFLESIKLKIENKTISTLRLPMFFTTGHEIIISLRKDNKNLIITNGVYKEISKEISNHISIKDVMKSYLLDDKRFSGSIKSNLTNNNIEHTLNLQKIIVNYIDLGEQNLSYEILNYCYAVIQHYNYIYNYSLAHGKEQERKKAFKNAMNNFVKTFNKEYEIKPYQNEETISSSNEYYNSNGIVFSGIRNKVNLLEAMEDLRDIVSEKDVNKGIILLDFIDKKIELNDSYLSIIEKKLKKKNIQCIRVKNDKLEELKSELQRTSDGI